MKNTYIKRMKVQVRRRAKKVKVMKLDRGRGGDPVRLAALLNDVMK